MKKTSYLLAFLAFLPTFSKIVEIENMIDALKYFETEKNILVVFDIDNTIAESTKPEGGDQWFYAAMQHFKNQGFNSQEAYDKVIPLYVEFNKKNGIKLVENKVVTTIQDLQNNNISVIALTARSKSIIKTTINQLKKLDVDFSKGSIAQKNVSFDKFSIPASFKSGIIFCGDNNKGKILKGFLKQTHLKPKKIIFLDDKRNCLSQVESTLKKDPIKFIGLRYGFLDKKVQKFKFTESMLKLPDE
ncbi:TPA: hypothetical protein DIC20_01165 [Candidatus Dependentiae bacterium]|nr:MAG: hypothetical protein US03_C0002G0158 [candidate division TM6 bacterium GW2011_GWF2_36_131]KKQ03591.1 MAG: hypothetical protein US13_C0002G0157 [candidate division TM6 bacterium GW2011_GWE2_36_25]KKQ20132.1 MAG: hypothetical protein US32_C0001G0029 [candidate division TM6 bacterium GW2011_GWA2_36_9]HBR70675.1 hypothetical protein [Candidatus Dependentiae bacterium]HCU00295.1 hypothetical protein [Candidatus Dependentiae bacterium]